MFKPTAVCLGASRRALTPKRGNKDYYKGTRQAMLPGGHRTGAPGKHVIGGSSNYRLLDEKVRVYVAPSLQVLNNSPLKPYVDTAVRLSKSQRQAVFGKLPSQGLTPEHFYKVAVEHAKPIIKGRKKAAAQAAKRAQ